MVAELNVAFFAFLHLLSHHFASNRLVSPEHESSPRATQLMQVVSQIIVNVNFTMQEQLGRQPAKVLN